MPTTSFGYRPAGGASYRPHQRGVMFGVCAELGDRAGMPAWVPRVAFVIGGIAHLGLAILLYGFLVYAFHRAGNRAAAAEFAATPPAARYHGGATTGFAAGFGSAGPSDPARKFNDLEQRLSRVETANLDGEAELRRRFRDLG